MSVISSAVWKFFISRTDCKFNFKNCRKFHFQEQTGILISYFKNILKSLWYDIDNSARGSKKIKKERRTKEEVGKHQKGLYRTRVWRMKIEKGGYALLRRHLCCPSNHQGKALKVKSMQRSGTEATRTHTQPSKPKWEITILSSTAKVTFRLNINNNFRLQSIHL